MNADHVCKTSLAVPYIHCAKADAKKMTAQKKKEANQKTNRISFKESTTKLSDKQQSLSYLDYLQTVQSFYSSDRDLYSRTLVFFYQSEVTSMQVNTLQGN